MAKRNLIDRARGVLGIEHREPEVLTHAPPQLDERAPAPASAAEAEPAYRFWPAGQEMPKCYIRHRKYPCPRCRRLVLPNGGQAVICSGLGEKANMRCKGCGHTFVLGVKDG